MKYKLFVFLLVLCFSATLKASCFYDVNGYYYGVENYDSSKSYLEKNQGMDNWTVYIEGLSALITNSYQMDGNDVGDPKDISSFSNLKDIGAHGRQWRFTYKNYGTYNVKLVGPTKNYYIKMILTPGPVNDYVENEGNEGNEKNEDDKVQLKYNLNSSNLTAEVTYYSSNSTTNNTYVSGDLRIPTQIVSGNKTYTVTSIGASAFKGCSNLLSVEIPNSVTSIGNAAFEKCTSLKKVTFGSYINSLGERCFYDCSAIESITLPNSVTSLGYQCFENCTSLTTVVLSNSLTALANSCFYRCVSLENVFIPNTIKKFGDQCFEQCSKLKSLIIPESVTSIGFWCFRSCASLTSIAIPGSVTSIKNGLFYECTNLKEVTFEDGSETLSLELTNFFNGPKLKKIYLGRNLSYPSQGSKNITPFYDQTALEEVIIGNYVKSLPAYLFSGCKSLNKITISASVNSIGNYAFVGCSSLKNVIFEDGETTLSLGYNGSGSALFSPCSLEYLYLGRNVSYSTGVSYGYSPFFNQRLLKEIIVGSPVTNLPDYLFCDCKGLTSIKLSDNIQKLSRHSLMNCMSLKSVELPAKLETLAFECFSSCHLLESITIPGSVTTIENCVFNDCPSIKEVIFEDGVSPVSIGYNTYKSGGQFYYCPLEKVYLGRNLSYNSTSSYGYSPFYNKNKISEIEIGANVSSLGNYCFYGCSSVESIISAAIYPPELQSTSFNNYNAILIVPNGTIDEYRQTLWANFLNIEEADGTGIVNDGIFSYRYNLNTKEAVVVFNSSYRNFTSASIPDRVYFNDIETPDFYTVTGIAAGAFRNCPNLEQVKIPAQCKEIGENAFWGCTNLTKLVIPTEINIIGSNAFGDCDNIDSIEVQALTPPTISVSSFSNYNADLIIPVGTWLKYMDSEWGKFLHIEDTDGNVISKYDDGVFCYVYYAGTKEAILIQSEKYKNMISASIPDRVYIEDELSPDFYHIIGIGENAFYGCSKLELLKLPATCQFIGESAFEGCSSLVNHLTIPNTVNSIGKKAFKDCTSLESISLPSNLDVISDYLFSGCVALRNISIPSSISSIGDYAFAGLNSMTNIEIPFGVASIGESAFEFCTSLEDVTIPESVINIGSRAFYNCSALQNFNLKDGLLTINIGENVFESTEGTTINLKKTYIGRNLEGDLNFGNVGISLKEVEIGYLVTIIPDELFKGCSGIEKLTINPSFSLKIGDSSFEGCSSLTEVIIPETVVSIGARAFFGVPIKDLVIPKSSIGDYAFGSNNHLETITLGNGVEHIGEYAFDGVNKIKQINATPNTPPEAFNTTFSYYEAPLYIPESSFDAYYNSHQCWYRFSTFRLIEPEDIEINVPEEIPMEDGGQFRIEANIIPEEVSLPQIIWHSSDPTVASVDNDGIVTLHVNDAEVTTNKYKAKQIVDCEIVASTLYDDGPVISIKITGTENIVSSIEVIRKDAIDCSEKSSNYSNDIYNIQGILLKRNASQEDVEALAPGLYIVGGKKVLVK